MNETTPNSTTAVDETTLKPLATDLQNDVALVVAVLKEYNKTKNAAEAVTSQLPQAVAAAKATYEDVVKALPTIKAGYKTTEFWLFVAAIAGNAVYTGVTGKFVPFDLNALLTTVVSIYASLRHVAKSNAAQ